LRPGLENEDKKVNARERFFGGFWRFWDKKKWKISKVDDFHLVIFGLDTIA